MPVAPRAPPRGAPPPPALPPLPTPHRAIPVFMPAHALAHDQCTGPLPATPSTLTTPSTRGERRGMDNCGTGVGKGGSGTAAPQFRCPPPSPQLVQPAAGGAPARVAGRRACRYPPPPRPSSPPPPRRPDSTRRIRRPRGGAALRQRCTWGGGAPDGHVAPATHPPLPTDHRCCVHERERTRRRVARPEVPPCLPPAPPPPCSPLPTSMPTPPPRTKTRQRG